MLNLDYNHSRAVENAYIITLKGHALSEKLSKTCQASCLQVDMPYTVWDAYDGTGSTIIEPEHLKTNTFMGMLKVADSEFTNSELACALSHISLWARCVEIGRPIVILEHDAIMVKPFREMNTYNSIVYLGCHLWAKDGAPIKPIPIYGSAGLNNCYLYKAHAYAIDPAVAKNLLADVLKWGVWTISDRMMRIDLYNITHQGLYAYEQYTNNNLTSITGRNDK